MKTRSPIYLITLAALFASCNSKNEETKPELAAPVAEQVAQKLSGDRTDNYYWMKLSDEQKNQGNRF